VNTNCDCKREIRCRATVVCFRRRNYIWLSHKYILSRDGNNCDKSVNNIYFGVESFVFPFAIQKYENPDKQKYTCACYFVCVCETRILTPREKIRLRVFKNGVLRRIFGPKGAR
jgi:hypothetical protein